MRLVLFPIRRCATLLRKKTAASRAANHNFVNAQDRVHQKDRAVCDTLPGDCQGHTRRRPDLPPLFRFHRPPRHARVIYAVALLTAVIGVDRTTAGWSISDEATAHSHSSAWWQCSLSAESPSQRAPPSAPIRVRFLRAPPPSPLFEAV